MAVLRGIDGCRGGWICVSLDLISGRVAVDVFESSESLFKDLSFAVAGIDIPIGLPSSSPRTVDRVARKLLGPRASSVFPVPVRAALDPSLSYDAACEVSHEQCGKRIPKQTYGILPKIREVDDALRASAGLRQRVFEVHPELSFWAWNGKQPMEHPKKSGFGFIERLSLIQTKFQDDVARVRDQVTRRDVADDDILDAFAVLWTAERIHADEALCIPFDVEEHDERGLPMRMLA